MSTDREALIDALTRFASRLAGDYDVPLVLEDLAQHVTAILRASGAAVALGHEGKLRYVTATDEETRAAEIAEEELQAGPCHQAFVTGEVVVSSDIEQDLDRWPEWGRAAIDAGFRSAVGFPMMSRGEAVGTVNVYNRTPRIWDTEALDVGQSLANVASAYVLGQTRLRQSLALTDQLQQALESRVAIEQAKGILAERHGISPEEAFTRLRDRARKQRQKLRDLAETVIRGEATDL